MNRRVEGVYATVEEAMAAVQRLRDEGYSRNDIFLVANADVRNNIPYTMDAEVTTDTDTVGAGADDDRSLWEKIKDAFTVDDTYDASVSDNPDYDASNDPLAAHHTDIANGNIVVLLDGDATPNVSGMPGYNSTAMGDRDAAGDIGMRDTTGTFGARDNRMDIDRDRDMDIDRDRDLDLDRDETIQLREEELDVDTREVQTGEVRIGKHIVEEQETVDVPVTHEEVTIERRPVTDRRAADGDIDMDLDEKEIVVPVTEEQVQIDKHTDVVEEVDVHKDKVTEDKRVTETVRREELDVDSTGNVRVDGTDVHHDHDRMGHEHGALDTDRDVLDRDRDTGILGTDRDALGRDRDTGILDNDRDTMGRDRDDDRSLMDKAHDALDRDNDGKIIDTNRDNDAFDPDMDRRTMDSDRGLFDNDPDRDRRI